MVKRASDRRVKGKSVWEKADGKVGWMIGALLLLAVVAPEPSPAGSGLPIREGGSFFKVKKINNAWWFIDPDGKPFYSIGVLGCSGVSLEFPPALLGHTEPAYYQELFARLEPNCIRWAKRFRAWGFNTCGAVGGNWNGRLPATPIFRCVFMANEPTSNVPKSSRYDFLDVYHPKFQAFCDAMARDVILPQRANPKIIGWFIDNEFHLPQDEAFQRQFYRVVIGVIRKYDPNHLILGTRHEYPNRTDMDLRIEGEFCDVLSANYYTLKPDRKLLERMYRLSGRPLLLGEFAFAAKDTGMPNACSHEGTLSENQFDRAKAYEIYTSHAAQMPFVVGTHFFLLGDRNEVSMNNWGLCDTEGKLYYGFISWLSQVHERLSLIHAGKLNPKGYPDFTPAFNDFPRTVDMANFGEKGEWVCQRAFLHYACTPGTGLFRFERDWDESWGYKKNGFIEYRFHMKADIKNAYLHLRYASPPRSPAHTLRVEVNDAEAGTLVCPEPGAEATNPGGYDFGYGAFRFGMRSLPLKVDLKKGELTSVRFCVTEPWKPKQGIMLNAFFIAAGPGTAVSAGDYYRLDR